MMPWSTSGTSNAVYTLHAIISTTKGGRAQRRIAEQIPSSAWVECMQTHRRALWPASYLTQHPKTAANLLNYKLGGRACRHQKGLHSASSRVAGLARLLQPVSSGRRTSTRSARGQNEQQERYAVPMHAVARCSFAAGQARCQRAKATAQEHAARANARSPRPNLFPVSLSRCSPA